MAGTRSIIWDEEVLQDIIDAALEQMHNGQTHTEEEVDLFFDEWLGKED